MASIEKRTGQNGKPEYRARWRDAEGQSRRSRWYERKYDADRHRATVEADLHRGAYVDMNNPVTVAEYFQQWAAARPLRPMTKRAYGILLRTHLEATPLGARPLVKVRPSEIQAWATSRAKPVGPLGPTTLRTALGVVRSMFATALLDGMIARNPVQPMNRLTLPQQEHNPVVPLTVEQVRALADAMPDRYRATVLVQAGLGLRVSELLALRAEDVNFLRRTVHVEYQLAPATLERIPPKTPKSRRDIPLPTVTAEVLAQHIETYPPAADGTLFTASEDRSRGGRPRVVGTPGRIDHGVYAQNVRRAAARAGLPPTTSHDLRHHYASVLLHAGESVHAVAERLGHTTAELVLRTYGHVMPNQDDRTRQAIDAAWTGRSDCPGAALGE